MRRTSLPMAAFASCSGRSYAVHPSDSLVVVAYLDLECVVVL